jgi:hypothetical protein
MLFSEAYQLMKAGAKIKLPSWGGYWYYDYDKQTIMIVTKDYETIDIRETKDVDYTFNNINSSEWMIAYPENTPVLGGINTFGFGTAIRLLKKGLKLARTGWNGKEQYIELSSNISYVNANNEIINVDHSDIGSKAIAFVGTRGVQLGWLASQADLLAEDWYIVENKR